MKLLSCVAYMAALGVLAFPVGRLYAKISFRADKFPFREYSFERETKIYSRLRVRQWQKLVPDVSRVFPKIVPRKELVNEPSCAKLRIMINETCVSEVTHVMLSVLGAAMIWLWPGTGGRILFAVYVLVGNLPYIIIQRYNRPRLIRLLRSAERKEMKQKQDSTSPPL